MNIRMTCDEKKFFESELTHMNFSYLEKGKKFSFCIAGVNGPYTGQFSDPVVIYLEGMIILYVIAAAMHDDGVMVSCCCCTCMKCQMQ